MEPSPGTIVLRPRPRTVAFLALTAAFMGLAAVQAWRTLDDPASYAVTAVCAVLSLLCLVGIRRARRLALHVSPYDVTVVHGDRERLRMRYQDLTEVRLTLTRPWHTTADVVNAFSLIGTTPDGHVRQLRIALGMVPTLEPVYDALAPIVSARPELLRSQEARELFATRSTRL